MSTSASRIGWVLFLSWLIAGGQSLAAKNLAISGKSVQYYTHVDVREVGDVAEHVVGTYKANGVTLNDDGEVSTHHSDGSFDQVKDEGAQEGFTYRTYDDGSTIVTRYEGRTSRKGSERWAEGTFTCTKGTGRFAEIQCSGTFRTRYLDNDMTVTEWRGKATLPDRKNPKQAEP